MRILVCGGRDYVDSIEFNNSMLEILHNYSKVQCIDTTKIADIYDTTIISGAAKGADTLAIDFAKYYNLPVLEYPADWKKYGKAAGAIRNQQMLDEGTPDLVVAFPGGNGTKDMVRRAKKAGIKVIEVKDGRS